MRVQRAARAATYGGLSRAIHQKASNLYVTQAATLAKLLPRVTTRYITADVRARVECKPT